MSYAVEWMPGGVGLATVLLLLLVPELAVIAVIAVGLAAVSILLVLAAAVLASPYLLARALRQRLAQPKRPRPSRFPRGGALAPVALAAADAHFDPLRFAGDATAEPHPPRSTSHRR